MEGGKGAEEEKTDQKAKLMALMGGGGGGIGGSVGTNSNSVLANLLGANASAGGSALQLGMPGMGGDVSNAIPGMPYTEHNVPSRPQYQMVPMSSIQHPLPGNAGEKHVSPIAHFICRKAIYTLVLS